MAKKKATTAAMKNKPVLPEDRWIKCMAQSGNLRATAIVAPNLVEDARVRHKLSRVETRVLGEALLGGLLLASTARAGERVSLSLKGDKFFRQCIVDATPLGKVRGFIIAKELEEDIDIERGPWQNGLLSVVRLKLHEKEPYVGTVPIVTGYLAKDLTFYLSQSEQIPSAVGIAVNVGKDGSVASAGAFIVQVMPGASKEEIALVESNINNLQSLAEKVAQTSNPTALLGLIFEDLIFTLLEERNLNFECTCSKDRIVRALHLVGNDEIQDMIEKDAGAEVNCDFCGKKYSFSIEDLETIQKQK